MTKPIQPESVEVTSLWKPASEMHAKLGWPYDFEEIEAIRDQARKMSDDDATMEAVAAVMQIADSRHRIASTTPTDEAVEASDLAKELLAQSFERSGEQKCAEAVRRGKVAGFGTPLWMDEALFAIRTALHTALSTPTDATAVEAERVSRNCANWSNGRCQSCGAQWQDMEVGPDFKCPHFRARTPREG
jgi:hypothetical protein